ncbi:MAG: GWxTD domain-containing protein, partial [Thermoanaerobaculia bacterium]
MTRRAARNALLAAGGLLLLAGLARSAAGPSRKELLAALPEEDRKWLTEYVAPIILPEEEKLFLEPKEPHLRERFQREFWARREREGLQPPLGPGYEGRYRELRSRADAVYDGWMSDAGQMVIRWGEPASIRAVQDCQYVFRDLEIWTYVGGPLGGSTAELGFYRPQLGAPRRLLDRQTRERDIFLPTSCRQTFASLWLDCPESPPMVKLADKCNGPVCLDACTVFHLYQRVLEASGAFQERSSLFAPARVPLEGIEKIKAMSATAADPNAKPLTVTGPSATVPVPAAPAAPARAVKKSKKELLADLPLEERAWLTEFVAPIIAPDEEQLFLELSLPEHFALFKEEFWKRRERDGQPFPMGPGYRGRYEDLRRKADEVYDGWREDAGRMVLRYGEPASIAPLEMCKMTFRDLELWTYRRSAQAQGTMHHFFYRKYPGAPRKLWTVGTSDGDVFSPGSCRKSFPSLVNACTTDARDKCHISDCAETCGVYQTFEEISARQGSRTGGEVEWGRLLESAKVSTEGLDSLRTRMLGAPFAGAPAPPPPMPRALRKSKKELLAALPDEEKAWLTSFAAPIILKEEEELFLDLTEGYQRDIFKKEFWTRRELDSLETPFGPGFQTRYEELRPRLDSVYDGWRNDAAQLVLHYGEPSDIHHVEGCDQVFRDIEIWTYTNLGVARGKTRHLFYRPQPVVPRKLWRETETPLQKQQGSDPYQFDEIFAPESCRKRLAGLRADCVPSPGDPCHGPVCFDACDVYRVYQEELSRQGSYLGGIAERARLFKLPEISTEGLDRLRSSMATTANPNAKQLSVQGPSSTPRATPAPTPTPEPVRALTAEEIRDRIIHLEPRYRQFLDLAGPLLTEDDLQRFLQM